MNKKEILHQVIEFRNGILGNKNPEAKGYMVCLPLQGYLSFIGIETKLTQGFVEQDGDMFQHYWLEWTLKKSIIDPTASQFIDPFGKKMSKVFMGPKPSWYIVD